MPGGRIPIDVKLNEWRGGDRAGRCAHGRLLSAEARGRGIGPSLVHLGGIVSSCCRAIFAFLAGVPICASMTCFGTDAIANGANQTGRANAALIVPCSCSLPLRLAPTLGVSCIELLGYRRRCSLRKGGWSRPRFRPKPKGSEPFGLGRRRCLIFGLIICGVGNLSEPNANAPSTDRASESCVEDTDSCVEDTSFVHRYDLSPKGNSLLSAVGAMRHEKGDRAHLFYQEQGHFGRRGWSNLVGKVECGRRVASWTSWWSGWAKN